MGIGSIGEAIGVLTLMMFKEESQKSLTMVVWLACLNFRGLRLESRRARLVRDFQSFRVNIFCLQEIHLIASDYKDILSKWFRIYSTYLDIHSRVVSWLVSRPLTVSCVLVFAALECRLCILDVTIKGKTLLH